MRSVSIINERVNISNCLRPIFSFISTNRLAKFGTPSPYYTRVVYEIVPQDGVEETKSFKLIRSEVAVTEDMEAYDK